MSNAVEDATKGAVKGVLEWTEDNIIKLVQKFRNHEIAFVQDKETAELIKRQDQRAEYKTICTYLPKEYKTLVRVGLSLQKINDADKLSQIKKNIVSQFGSDNLHIINAVQNGIVTQLLTQLLKVYESPADVQNKLVAFLKQVDQLIIFVKNEDNNKTDRIAKLIMDRVDTNSSQMAIIFGRGEARKVVKKILEIIQNDPLGYYVIIEEVEDIKSSLMSLITVFVFSPEIKEKLVTKFDPLL